MKKSVALCLVLFIVLQASSQIALPDSIIKKIKADSTIAELKYDTEFNRKGQKVAEGWSCILKPGTSIRWVSFKVGDWVTYYKNGEVFLEEYIPYDLSQYSTSVQYNKNGVKVFAFQFKMNQYGNDRYEAMRKLRNWPKEFCAENYYNNGSKKREFCKVSIAGFDGPFKKYFKSGKLMLLGQYNQGKKVGEWKWFDSNGNLKKSKTY